MSHHLHAVDKMSFNSFVATQGQHLPCHVALQKRAPQLLELMGDNNMSGSYFPMPNMQQLQKYRSCQPQFLCKNIEIARKNGFEIVNQEIEAQLSKAQESFKITDEYLVQGRKDIYPAIKCRSCNAIPKLHPVECAHCEAIFCETCSSLYEGQKGHASSPLSGAAPPKQQCPMCKKEFKKKDLNRKVRDIMFRKLRFQCPCDKVQQVNVGNLLDRSFGADQSDQTTISTESLLNEVLFKQDQNNQNFNIICQSPKSPRKFQKKDDQEEQSCGVSNAGHLYQPDIDYLDPDYSISSPQFRKSPLKSPTLKNAREQKQAEKDLKRKQLTNEFEQVKQLQSTKVNPDSDNRKTYTHKEFIEHKQWSCPLREMYYCPNSQCLRDNFQTIEQLKSHMMHECLHTTFECQNCNVRLPFYKIDNGQHTKDDCIRNLKNQNSKHQKDKDRLAFMYKRKDQELKNVLLHERRIRMRGQLNVRQQQPYQQRNQPQQISSS